MFQVTYFEQGDRQFNFNRPFIKLLMKGRFLMILVATFASIGVNTIAR